jgi:hypothetical protein
MYIDRQSVVGWGSAYHAGNCNDAGNAAFKCGTDGINGPEYANNTKNDHHITYSDTDDNNKNKNNDNDNDDHDILELMKGTIILYIQEQRRHGLIDSTHYCGMHLHPSSC